MDRDEREELAGLEEPEARWLSEEILQELEARYHRATGRRQEEWAAGRNSRYAEDQRVLEATSQEENEYGQTLARLNRERMQGRFNASDFVQAMRLHERRIVENNISQKRRIIFYRNSVETARIKAETLRRTIHNLRTDQLELMARLRGARGIGCVAVRDAEALSLVVQNLHRHLLESQEHVERLEAEIQALAARDTALARGITPEITIQAGYSRAISNINLNVGPEYVFAKNVNNRLRLMVQADIGINSARRGSGFFAGIKGVSNTATCEYKYCQIDNQLFHSLKAERELPLSSGNKAVGISVLTPVYGNLSLVNGLQRSQVDITYKSYGGEKLQAELQQRITVKAMPKDKITQNPAPVRKSTGNTKFASLTSNEIQLVQPHVNLMHRTPEVVSRTNLLPILVIVLGIVFKVCKKNKT